MGYNIIRRLFGRKKKEEIVPEEPEPSFLVSIVIGSMEDGDLDIKCEWQEENEITAVLLAEMLFYLESGFLGPYIQNILIRHVSENPEAGNFIMSTFTLLSDMSKAVSDKPLVRPSRVFGNEEGDAG